jgi:hypothetical protein
MVKQTAAAVVFTLYRIWCAVRGEPCPCEFCREHREFIELSPEPL